MHVQVRGVVPCEDRIDKALAQRVEAKGDAAPIHHISMVTTQRVIRIDFDQNGRVQEWVEAVVDKDGKVIDLSYHLQEWLDGASRKLRTDGEQDGDRFTMPPLLRLAMVVANSEEAQYLAPAKPGRKASAAEVKKAEAIVSKSAKGF